MWVKFRTTILPWAGETALSTPSLRTVGWFCRGRVSRLRRAHKGGRLGNVVGDYQWRWLGTEQSRVGRPQQHGEGWLSYQEGVEGWRRRVAMRGDVGGGTNGGN